MWDASLVGWAEVHASPACSHICWFDRRLGIAVTLISSVQYIAGVVWPALFERGMSAVGWQATMLGFAVVVAGAIVLLALFLRPPPQLGRTEGSAAGMRRRAGVLRLNSNLVQALLCTAAFLCCVP